MSTTAPNNPPAPPAPSTPAPVPAPNSANSGSTSLSELWGKQPSRIKSIVLATAGVVATAVGLVAPNVSGGLDSINGCGISGNVKTTWEARGNPLKNRWTIPSGETLNANVSFDSLVNATSSKNDMNLPVGSFSSYTAPDGSVFNENESAEIVGYIAEVKVGGTESCNCSTSDEQYMDTHIYITGTSGSTDKTQCIIVEVTPRMRALKAAQGVDWSTPTLISTLKPGTRVQITGWLFDDLEHMPNSLVDPGHGSNVWRGSCWEIHPVTDIQVLGPGVGS